jgi:hypothetical protein
MKGKIINSKIKKGIGEWGDLRVKIVLNSHLLAFLVTTALFTAHMQMHTSCMPFLL